jgi:hypothetical protein
MLDLRRRQFITLLGGALADQAIRALRKSLFACAPSRR